MEHYICRTVTELPSYMFAQIIVPDGNTISADHGLNMVNRLMLEERLSVLPDIEL